MSMHEGLPVPGYRRQSQNNIDAVTANKQLEETILRTLDLMKTEPESIDQRWLAIGRTHIEQGFMAINRAIFQPTRVKLPGDPE